MSYTEKLKPNAMNALKSKLERATLVATHNSDENARRYELNLAQGEAFTSLEIVLMLSAIDDLHGGEGVTFSEDGRTAYIERVGKSAFRGAAALGIDEEAFVEYFDPGELDICELTGALDDISSYIKPNIHVKDGTCYIDQECIVEPETLAAIFKELGMKPLGPIAAYYLCGAPVIPMGDVADFLEHEIAPLIGKGTKIVTPEQFQAVQERAAQCGREGFFKDSSPLSEISHAQRTILESALLEVNGLQQTL